MKPESKYKGAIELSAIGDALGWITEFEASISQLENKYDTDLIDRFYDWSKFVGGRFYGYKDNISAGSYSDDTQLLLATARSISRDGSVDNEYFGKNELANWIYYARGGGRTVKTAASKISRKGVKWNQNFFTYSVKGEINDYRNAGANGAAMRVLPIALANLGDFQKIKVETFKNSIVTHGHPRAIIGALLYNLAINQILQYRPSDFSWENYITFLGKTLPTEFNLQSIDFPELKDWIQEWDKPSDISFQNLYNEVLEEAQALLRICYQLLRNDSSDKDALEKLGCLKSETKGSGLSTVIAGILFASKYNYKPIDAIRSAVNGLGSDTDTIASFTGGLVGALHGNSIIPDRWKNVQDFNYLEKTAIDLLNISEGNAKDNIENKKYSKASFVEESNWNFKMDQKVYFSTLGEGIITNIEKQETLTKGKYNLIVDVIFEIGQSCRFSKIHSKDETKFNDDEFSFIGNELEADAKLQLVQKLQKKTLKREEVLEILKWFKESLESK